MALVRRAAAPAPADEARDDAPARREQWVADLRVGGCFDAPPRGARAVRDAGRGARWCARTWSTSKTSVSAASF